MKENRLVQEKMKKTIESAIVQQLITAVLQNDRDMDLKLNPHEVKELTTRLKCLPGFDFQEHLFEKVVGPMNKAVPAEKIVEVIRNLKK